MITENSDLLPTTACLPMCLPTCLQQPAYPPAYNSLPTHVSTHLPTTACLPTCLQQPAYPCVYPPAYNSLPTTACPPTCLQQPVYEPAYNSHAYLLSHNCGTTAHWLITITCLQWTGDCHLRYACTGLLKSPSLGSILNLALPLTPHVMRNLLTVVFFVQQLRRHNLLPILQT